MAHDEGSVQTHEPMFAATKKGPMFLPTKPIQQETFGSRGQLRKLSQSSYHGKGPWKVLDLLKAAP